MHVNKHCLCHYSKCVYVFLGTPSVRMQLQPCRRGLWFFIQRIPLSCVGSLAPGSLVPYTVQPCVTLSATPLDHTVGEPDSHLKIDTCLSSTKMSICGECCKMPRATLHVAWIKCCLSRTISGATIVCLIKAPKTMSPIAAKDTMPRRHLFLPEGRFFCAGDSVGGKHKGRQCILGLFHSGRTAGGVRGGLFLRNTQNGPLSS